MNNSDQLRELEERCEEMAYSNKFAQCACGHVIELIGSHDVELIRCGSCLCVGKFTVEVE
jgi:hypothetical protein